MFMPRLTSRRSLSLFSDACALSPRNPKPTQPKPNPIPPNTGKGTMSSMLRRNLSLSAVRRAALAAASSSSSSSSSRALHSYRPPGPPPLHPSHSHHHHYRHHHYQNPFHLLRASLSFSALPPTGGGAASDDDKATKKDKQQEREKNVRILRTLAQHLWPSQSLHTDATSLKVSRVGGLGIGMVVYGFVHRKEGGRGCLLQSHPPTSPPTHPPTHLPNQKARVCLSMGLLISSKLITIQVPFIFKNIVDQLNTAEGAAFLTDGSLPLAMLLGYGVARTTATAFQELRNSVGRVGGWVGGWVSGLFVHQLMHAFTHPPTHPPTQVFATVAQKAIRKVARDVFTHLHDLELNYHLNRSTGAISRVIDRGSRSINFVLSALLFNIVPTAFEISVRLSHPPTHPPTHPPMPYNSSFQPPTHLLTNSWSRTF